MKRATKTPADAHAGSSRILSTPAGLTSEQATANPVSDTGSNQDTIPALDGETEKKPGDPKLSAPTEKKKKAPRKTRLVSYISQEDSQDDTASRRSGKKRTAVTKMGGVMIDYINKNDREEGKLLENLKLKKKLSIKLFQYL